MIRTDVDGSRMNIPSVHQEFWLKYSLQLDDRVLSPQRKMELNRFNQWFHYLATRKQRWLLVLTFATTLTSFSLIFALAGFHVFWVLAIPCAASAGWSFKIWQKASEQLNGMLRELPQFMAALFQDLNEVYAAQKEHGRLRWM